MEVEITDDFENWSILISVIKNIILLIKSLNSEQEITSSLLWLEITESGTIRL